MSAPDPGNGDREERLGAVVFACLQALEAGERLGEPELRARYPDVAEELLDYLAGRQDFEHLAAPLRALAQADSTDLPALTFLVPPASDSRAAVLAGSFGDYELLEEIGQGGMGVVYKARQKSLNRLVALKMIRRGDLGPEEERRFRHEAEIVAGLDHPNIVPVYEVGEEQGRHYFSMKLMDGGSLARQLVRFAADPHSAARLVATVARAVHHAHQRTILHRDLKPANILLDRDGTPHVTDFCLAKRLAADSDLTHAGSLVGTPSYMAPEQTCPGRATITTAADVYGLGAILYALLTGGPPFRGADALETLEQVRKQAPEPPQKVNPRVDRDLATICLKCLEKEPERRYRSAEALAEDLECFLAGKPIQARPAGPVERLWRWCRRNPAVAVASGIAALLLIALLIGLAVSNRLIRQEETRADTAYRAEAEQRRQADAARQEAEANLVTACRTVDQMLTRVATKDLAHTPQMTSVQRKLLGDALAFWQALLEKRPTDAAVRRQAGRSYQLMGQINRKLGQPDQARVNYDQAVAILQQLAADYPEATAYRLDLSAGYHNRSLVLQEAGRIPQADQDQRQALAILEQLVADNPKDQTARFELANAHHNWGILLEQTGRLDQAEKAYQDALRLRQELADDGLDDRRNRHERAATLHDLATLLEDRNRPREAEPLLRQALAVQKDLVAQYGSVPDHREALARSYGSLGRLLKKNHPKEAEDAYRKAVDLEKQLTTDFPEVPAYRQELANSYDGLGLFLLAAYRDRGAAAAHREALALRQGLVSESPDVPDYQSGLGATLNNLGLLDYVAGNLAEAHRLFEQAIDHQQRALDRNPRHPTYRRFLRNHYRILGQTWLRLQDHAEAARVAARLVKALADDGQAARDAAGCLAGCVPLAEQDARLPEDKRKELGQAYGQRAVEQLARAVQMGFRDVQALEKAPEFAPLRPRTDFQQLLVGLKPKGHP
jgi:tetratricopeptide (TPR) repeat protein